MFIIIRRGHFTDGDRNSSYGIFVNKTNAKYFNIVLI